MVVFSLYTVLCSVARDNSTMSIVERQWQFAFNDRTLGPRSANAGAETHPSASLNANYKTHLIPSSSQ